MASPNHTSLAANEMIIEIPMEEGEPLGATPDEHLIIQRIQSQTIAEGKLMIGDQILKIRGINIRDLNHFYQLMRYAPPLANFTILRNVHKVPAIDSNIPPEREKIINRRSGFIYILAEVTVPKGETLGLFLKSYQNRVLVSRIGLGTHAAGHIMRLDHIIDVDGSPVSDKRVADGLIKQSIWTRGCFTCVIARPTTGATKEKIEEDLVVINNPPSERLNLDVRRIAEMERHRLSTANDQPIPILRAPDAPVPTNPSVSFNETANQLFNIGNDNVGVALNPVPPK